MKTIQETQDYNGDTIKVGDSVITDNPSEQGKITEIYDNGSVDIHISNSHQGSVIDSYDIIGREVQKVEPLPHLSPDE